MRTLLPLLACAACSPQIVGDGNVTEEAREVFSFRSVSIEGPITTTITGGGAERAVSVRADSNVLEAVITSVEGSTLYLSLDRAVVDATIEVAVSNVSIQGIYNDGTAPVEAFDLATSGLEVVGYGNSTLVARGALVSSEVVTTGNALVDLGDLETSNVHVEHASSQTLTVWATEAVDGEIRAAGDLVVKGSPETRDVADNGSGSVVYE